MSASQFQLNNVQLENISACRSEDRIPDQMSIGIANNEKNYVENKIIDIKIDTDITIEDVAFSISLKANIKIISLEKEVGLKDIGLTYGSELLKPLIDKASLHISTIFSDMVGIPSVIDLSTMLDFESAFTVE